MSAKTSPAPAGLVSKADFCRRLRIHPCTFTDWMDRGYIDVVRVGNRLFVTDRELDAVVSGKKRWIKKAAR